MHEAGGEGRLTVCMPAKKGSTWEVGSKPAL